MTVAFFVSPKVSIGMFVGSMATYRWGRADDDGSHGARLLSPAVSCGLICGDGFGSLLSSVLTLSRAQAPICIKFLSREANVSLDVFLATKATS
uniref:Uncharacterized protein n=1 Tax=Oryza punctata TaxID=4537 RepID=A0A0E0KV10_ORYPU